MSKYIVVSVNRDSWRFPVLKIVVEARVASIAAGKRFIAETIMGLYEKRRRGKFGRIPSMRVKDLRVVDEVGLKRLQAAAKASVTVRRKRAAQKAAATRAKNRAAKARYASLKEGPYYYSTAPKAADYAVN